MANTFKFGNGKWAVKDGYALAYNDENGNFKPLPFDFTRATSATRVNKQGLIETVASGVPRIDFTDANGALLLEPSRTNLYTYSNDVSFWSKSNVVTTSNYAISPDGTQNAFRAAFSSSTGLLYVTATGTTGTNNTLSVWAKSNNGSSNKFRFFANGTTTLSNDFIATDEWQRFEFTYNCTSVTSGLTGASDSATNDIIFYGFQHEVGSYPTSYIPTQGSAVTRVADACSDAGNSQIFNDSEGVLFAEIEPLVNDASLRTISISDGTDSNEIFLQFSNSTSRIECRVIVGGVLQSQLLYIFPNSNEFLTMSKFALKYKENDFSLWVNGTEKVVDTSGSVPSNNVLDLLKFERAAAGQEFYGNTKQIQYFNTALTDAELQALTS